MSTIAVIEIAQSVGPDSIQIVGTLTDQISFKTPFNVTLIGPLTLDSVKARLLSLLDNGQSQDLILKELNIGKPLDLTPPVVNPPPPPTQDELDLAAFRAAQNNWRSAKRKIDDGTIKSDDVDALALLTNLQKLYQVKYLTID